MSMTNRELMRWEMRYIWGLRDDWIHTYNEDQEEEKEKELDDEIEKFLNKWCKDET